MESKVEKSQIKEMFCTLCGKPIPPKEYRHWKTGKKTTKVYANTKYCSNECRFKANIGAVWRYRKAKNKVTILISKENRTRLNEIKESMKRNENQEKLYFLDDVISYLFDVLGDYKSMKLENQELKNQLRKE